MEISFSYSLLSPSSSLTRKTNFSHSHWEQGESRHFPSSSLRTWHADTTYYFPSPITIESDLFLSPTHNPNVVELIKNWGKRERGRKNGATTRVLHNRGVGSGQIDWRQVENARGFTTLVAPPSAPKSRLFLLNSSLLQGFFCSTRPLQHVTIPRRLFVSNS